MSAKSCASRRPLLPLAGANRGPRVWWHRAPMRRRFYPRNRRLAGARSRHSRGPCLASAGGGIPRLRGAVLRAKRWRLTAPDPATCGAPTRAPRVARLGALEDAISLGGSGASRALDPTARGGLIWPPCVAGSGAMRRRFGRQIRRPRGPNEAPASGDMGRPRGADYLQKVAHHGPRIPRLAGASFDFRGWRALAP